MKLRIKCDVQSEVILQRRLELKTEGRNFAFEIGPDGIWNALTVLADIKDSSKVRWGTGDVQGPRACDQAPFSVVGTFADSIVECVIEDIQSLESALSIYMPIRQINWRYPETEVIFEEGDERTLGHLGAVSVSHAKPAPSRIAEKAFVSIVGIGLKAQSLTVVASFWREGENDWADGKFINAFFNYYFVLEGLYGNKKTKNWQVEEEMLKSPELLAQIEKFNKGNHPIQHLDQLAKMMNVTEIPTAEQLVNLLVSTRGRLHHFQNNPNREQGSPLVHDKYEGIGYFARQLAHGSILDLMSGVPAIAFSPRGPT
jgi:hypothetical protein